MDKEKNREMWLAKIAEFKQSTLSQREWCRQNNLKLSTFKYWLSRSEKSRGTVLFDYNSIQKD